MAPTTVASSAASTLVDSVTPKGNNNNNSNKAKLTSGSGLLASLTPKSLTKFTLERSTTAPAHPSHVRTIPLDATPEDSAPHIGEQPQGSDSKSRNNSTASGRSDSTVSGSSTCSGGSEWDCQSNTTSSSKRSSIWNRSLFTGMRSKSQSSLTALEKNESFLLEHADVPAVPTCLQGHECRLRRIVECSQKNVNGLIVRTQHTENDIMQMVAQHCSHVGCRRKLVNAAMRNLERRISMLNKYRDAIFHFVVNRHQEVLQKLPLKKAEAEALFDMCARNAKTCMDLANQGAHNSGTILVSISDRLHKLQRQLNETTQQELSAHATNSNSAPTRAMSTLSTHTHGEGDTEDYVMSVVATVPQPITFKLQRPAKTVSRMCSTTSTNNNNTLARPSGGFSGGSHSAGPGSPVVGGGAASGSSSPVTGSPGFRSRTKAAMLTKMASSGM